MTFSLRPIIKASNLYKANVGCSVFLVLTFYGKYGNTGIRKSGICEIFIRKYGGAEWNSGKN